MHTLSCFLLAFLIGTGVLAQTTPKTLPAKRTTASIKIDGVLDEAAWKEALPAKDFIEWRPTPGKPEAAENRTEVFFLYDNTSVYIAGYCHERTKDSISKELIGRDRVGVNDFVGVIFDTYYDKINGVGFYVTPLGEQYDAKYSSTFGEDDSWNAVWDSESQIVSDGWTFEMRIPYSALRFNRKDVQTWGMNITRRRNKTGQQYMWNPVDPNVNGFVNQEGEWTGIERIDPPLRLSLSPYFSTYLNHYPSKTPGIKDLSSSVNGGMDVKYGINESFTLDMTLIPDFGQVQADNRVLNLTPFEVRYNENRSFFTEGTELFNKGNLFYSRRVGSQPIRYWDVEGQLAPGERLYKNPSESKLINATKISGRTKKKLGIGFFNAVTKPMFAEIETGAKQYRKFQTNPLTNYNILVLDQALKNNSSVSFINTNVLRNGSSYDANVSAGLFDFNNKKNTYNVNGKFALSQISRPGEKNNRVGYSHNLGFGKTGGRWNFQFVQEVADEKYDINDMGILFNNNFMEHYFWTGYRWQKPKGWYNQIRVNYNANYSRLFKKWPGQFVNTLYQGFNTNVNANVQWKNLWWTGAFIGYRAKGNDFYEPRSQGWSFRSPSAVQSNIWLESNEAKKYSFGGNLFVAFHDLQKGREIGSEYFHRYRFNDKFSLRHEIDYQPFKNNVGFYSNSGSVLFSLRDVTTVENEVQVKYNFNNKTGINIRTRHYWSKVNNRRFFQLEKTGELSPAAGPADIRHRNYNYFTVDAVFTKQFAPGSFINVVWKNIIETFDGDIQHAYFKNFDRTVSAPQNNNLSLRIIYFLDYVDVKKWRKNKE